MEVEGRLIMELPMQEGVSKSGNPWKKREWVLETPGAYPRKVKFHIFGNRADELGKLLQVGRDYVLSVDLESREFNGRWYTDVSCYAVRESVPGAYQQPGAYQPAAMPQAPGYPQPGAMPQPGDYQQPAAPGGFSPAPAAGGFSPAPAQEGSTDDLPF